MKECKEVNTKNVNRVLAMLLCLVMVLGVLPATALAAGGDTKHVVINQVYGASEDGYADHSFIELYNPTSEPVNMNGWSIQYKSSESGSHSTAWQMLKLTGTIAAKGYYLIRCGEVTNTGNVNYIVPDGNQQWDIMLHNKGVSVVLMSNTQLLTDSFAGNIMADGFNLPEGFVDLAAVQGNDGLDDQIPPAYEGAYAAVQSKKKSIRRVDGEDTDNNANDFEVVDYSNTVTDKGPHAGENAESSYPSSVGEDTVWSYSDDGVDPAAGMSLRTAWTTVDYDVSAWKTASGSFGAKKGVIAELDGGYIPDNLLNQYKTGTSTDIEAFFFRTNVTVEDAGAVTAITGSVIYDDGVIVYLNGVRIGAFDDTACDSSGNSLNKGFDENMQYGGSNASAPKTGTINITDKDVIASAVKTGVNVIAVELHQGRESSSDVYMQMPSLEFRTSSETDSAPASVPTNVVMNIGADETEASVTWYTTSTQAGVLELTQGTKTTEIPAVNSATSTTADNGYAYYKNTAKLTGLTAGTEYSYRVSGGTNSDGTVWSKSYSFTTQTQKAHNEFTFIAVGDPQIGCSNVSSDTQGWTNTMQTALSNAPEANFVMSLGDQINNYSAGSQLVSEYNGFLDEAAMLTGIPLATIVGNHDDGYTAAYTEHYTLPNVSEYGSSNGDVTGEEDYYYTYNGVLFMVINSNNASASEHEAFMRAAIEAAPDAKWRVVAFHHSLYSVASHAYDDQILQLRERLAPIITALDVDVVLQGHDHVYVRSWMMGGESGQTVLDTDKTTVPSEYVNPEGTLYLTLNSASGSKYYSIKNEVFDYSAVQNQEKTPNYSVIKVDDTSFTVTTYRSEDNSIVDTVTIVKEAPASVPTNVVMNIGADETEASVTWYTTSTQAGVLELTQGTKTTEIPAVNSATSTTADNGYAYYKNTAKLTGLTAGTEYSYRVSGGTNSDGTVWSKSYSFTTQTQKAHNEFTFIAVGDPQIGCSNVSSDTQGWTNTMQTALSNAPEANFVMSLGDQINNYSAGSQLVSEYNGFLDEAAMLTGIPLATIVGNHDDGYTAAYTEHYTLPNVSEYGSSNGDVTGEEDYYYTYNGVLFMVINSNNASASEHEAFMRAAIEAAPDAKWRVVAFHHSLYSVASHAYDDQILQLRERLAPIITALDVDVVLQGHDHVYVRSWMMGGESGQTVLDTDKTTVPSEYVNPEGTLYLTLNSASGSKYYNIKSEVFDYSAVQNQEKTPNYSVIKVDDTSFTVTTYRSKDNSVVDTVTIRKLPVYPPYSVGSIIVDKADNGTVTASASKALTGQKVTVTAVADTGYELKSITAVTAGGVKVELTKSGENTYTFIMPGMDDVTITAVFTAIKTAPECPSAKFTDVSESAWYHEAVDYVIEKGLMVGTSETKFSPESSTTRGQIVTVLWRLAGSPEPYRLSGFTDVASDKYYAKAIAWASENGIVTGYTSTKFGPEDYVTREQLAAILWRLAGKNPGPETRIFTDSDKISPYAVTAVNWCVNNGILQGKDSGNLDPMGFATRAHVAAMLMRYIER